MDFEDRIDMMQWFTEKSGSDLLEKNGRIKAMDKIFVKSSDASYFFYWGEANWIKHIFEFSVRNDNIILHR